MTRHEGIRRWVGLLLVGLLLVPATLSAQESGDDGRDVDKETAKEVLQLLRDGKKAYKAEDYETAQDRFQEAYDKWERSEILLRLGKTAEELGQTKTALQRYRTFLDEKPDADIREKIEDKIAKLEKKVPATLTLASTPEGVAVVGPEGEQLGETPLDLEVEPGEHTYVFRADGYEKREKTFEVSGGEEMDREVTLEKKEEETSDDQAAPKADSDDEEMSPRERAIARKKAEEEADEQTAKPLNTWGWITGATGVAGVGTGVVFTMLQNSTVDEVNTYQRGLNSSSRDELNSMKDQARSHHRIAVIGYAAGGALAATGVGLLIHQHFIRNDASQTQRARVAPNIGFAEDGGWAGLRIDF
jgi:tetratricopeptide (TPR) repeat protein